MVEILSGKKDDSAQKSTWLYLGRNNQKSDSAEENYGE